MAAEVTLPLAASDLPTLPGAAPLGQPAGPPPLPRSPASLTSGPIGSPAGDAPPPAPAVPPTTVALPPPSAGVPAQSGAPPVWVEEPEPSRLRHMSGLLPGWLGSMVFHLGLMILLALGAIAQQTAEPPGELLVSAGVEGLEIEELPLQDMEVSEELEPVKDILQIPDPQAVGELSRQVLTPMPIEPEIGHKTDLAASAFGSLPGSGDLLKEVIQSAGNSLENRLSSTGRAYMLRTGGGTPESEKAVANALRWLAEHQNADGSWSFNHQLCPKCRGRCRNPGNMIAARNAATAMALLPFLGTGETHKQGKYKQTIQQGLHFLVRHMQVDGDVGSFHENEGRMYAHGMASIVLCEVYGMTHDKAYQAPAQAALNFIVQAQDPAGGGWRYKPGQPGDTSVVGWQLMALKSGHMAYLKVPKETIHKAGEFLTSVQTDYGAGYGYLSPGDAPATTSIGLLCRMYMGWRNENPALTEGVKRLSKLGPSTDRGGPGRHGLYYDYYATQVMHHYGGYPWKQWNEVMREYLIRTQARRGHEAGSWAFQGGDHGSAAGGRLYCTSMAAMILEVYYRHMPLYSDQSTHDRFE